MMMRWNWLGKVTEVERKQKNKVEVGKPHVVILGAGASRASFLTGDRMRVIS